MHARWNVWDTGRALAYWYVLPSPPSKMCCCTAGWLCHMLWSICLVCLAELGTAGRFCIQNNARTQDVILDSFSWQVGKNLKKEGQRGEVRKRWGKVDKLVWQTFWGENNLFCEKWVYHFRKLVNQVTWQTIQNCFSIRDQNKNDDSAPVLTQSLSCIAVISERAPLRPQCLTNGPLQPEGFDDMMFWWERSEKASHSWWRKISVDK